MAIGTIASVAAIVVAAASIANMGYQAAQGAPKIPGGASSSKAVADAQAAALPIQKGLAAAEAQGGEALNFGYTTSTASADQRAGIQNRIADLNGLLDAGSKPGQNALSPEGKAIYTGQIKALQSQLEQLPAGGGTIYKDSNGKIVPREEAVANFKGYGTADIEGKLAGQMTDIQTNLGAKYGKQFAQEARTEAQQADPMGFAARQKELDLINNEIDKPMPINPMATTLDQRMAERVKAGSGLDDMSRNLLDEAVSRSNADRGGSTSAGDVAGIMSTGNEGAARRQAGTTAAGAWLSSGATPEDVAYRREQQNLANLGSFIGGQTPQSQFQNLSGASQGAAPFYPGQPGPTQPNNASTVGPAYSVAAWQKQLAGQSGQANSWMAGLSSIMSGVSSAAKATGG
jgi:hypothetical protein